ncbi:MAG: TRAP transporter small permease [Alphaproteobacteria bacterium]|nr:TRAP transporter small permease [Alphaproteobacteria bacterium]
MTGAPPPQEAAFDRLCRLLAIAGGIVLLAASALTVASVLGRYFLGRPVPGDIELVALAMAVSVSLFMPWCELRHGHVVVDVATDRAPARVRAALDAVGSILLAAGASLLAWRMALGGVELRAAGDESMVLRLPTWIGFVVAVPCFALMAAAGVVTAARRLRAGGDAAEVPPP